MRREELRREECPACGAPLAWLTDSVRVACSACQALFAIEGDALVFHEQLEQEAIAPVLALGSEGVLFGERVRVVAIRERLTVVRGATRTSRETLLDADAGPRWLVEEAGHWLRLAPVTREEVTRRSDGLVHRGRVHRLFSSRPATLRYVAGALPYAVEMGERANVTIHVGPPRVIREEGDDLLAGEHVKASTVYEAFGLAGSPPRPTGVAPAQPNPHGLVPIAVAVVVLAAAFVGVGAGLDWGRERLLYRGELALPATPTVLSGPGVLPDRELDRGTTTAPFTVSGEATTVGFRLTTRAHRDLVDVACALIDEDRGEVRELHLRAGAESGSDDAGEHEAWAILDRVPSGRYALWLAPEWIQRRSAGTSEVSFGRAEPPPHASLEVVEGARTPWCAIVALALWMLPFALILWRRARFERRRWAEASDA